MIKFHKIYFILLLSFSYRIQFVEYVLIRLAFVLSWSWLRCPTDTGLVRRLQILFLIAYILFFIQLYYRIVTVLLL